MTFKHKLSARLALMKDALLVLALAALGCEKPVALTTSTATARLQIIPKSVTLPTDGITQLTAVAFTPAGDTANTHVNWTVTGGSIADTSTNGGRHYAGYKATPAAGVFRVVASATASSSDTATVTVIRTRVASVKVTPAVVSLLIGTAVQLTATTTDSAANVLSGRTISWSSSAPAVASVNGAGLATSVGQGSATITATSEGQSAAVPVTVTSVPVASIQVSPASASVFVGQTLSLTATTKDSAGGALSGRPVTWATNNSSVATVSSGGLVTGVTQGSATMTATSEGKSAAATITVSIVPVASVRVSPTSANVQVRQTLQLTATPQDSAGGPMTGRPVTWASSNTSIATVSNTGLVTGVVAGTATITATSEGKSGTAALTVTMAPVASVQVSPATAGVQVGQGVQLSATPKDSAGTPLTGRTVTWASSNTGVATVSSNGLVTGVVAGTATITATSEGKSGTSALTVQAPAPSGSVPDPTLLPTASGQAPNVVAYTALNLPSRPAGFSYNDPVSGVKIWKVTSSTIPSANSGAGHDYADGPNQVSRGWGPNNNTHTLLIRGDGLSAYYLVDFTRGVGFTNYRPLTGLTIRDLAFTFSSVAGQERIAYGLDHGDGRLHRYNTATMAVEDIGFFPVTLNTATPANMTWLHQDKTDGWFVGLWDATTAFAWNSQTNQLLTHAETWLNEIKLERDGRYLGLTGGGPGPFRVWDLATNTFGPVQSIGSGSGKFYFSHNAGCRSMWMSVNPDLIFGQDRMVVSGGQIVKTQISTFGASGGDEHHAGNWIQADAELGGNLMRQWSYLDGNGVAAWSGQLQWNQALGVERNDGSDARLLAHHYSINISYWDYPFVSPSPDGKVVIFNSNMNGSGRYDLFIAEVPLR
jgi:uncharacterized protein YjdB